MVILKRAEPESRWDAAPLTWWPGTSDGKRTAIVACVNGHAMSISSHAIAADGTVSPSLVCPIDGCGWHVFARLDGWEKAG